jgi:hypothetical protein
MLALVKRPSALPKRRSPLCTLVHWLVAVHSATLPLHWVEGITTAITLVAALPEGGIYYSQVYLVWSSDEALVTALIAPLPLPRSGATDNRDMPTDAFCLKWARLYAGQMVILVVNISPIEATMAGPKK